MKTIPAVFFPPALFLLLILLSGCLLGRQLPAGPATPVAITGTYTLYLYGCHYPADVKNVGLLIRDGAKYPFEIFDLDTSYKIKKGIPAAQALLEAQAFLRCTTRRMTHTALRRISDDAGGTMGYEVRPLYFALEFGTPDILLISYALKDGVVRAYISYQPNVENAIENTGPDTRDSSH